MAEFIQLNKPTEAKTASQNPQPSPAKKIRLEEQMFTAKKINGGAEQQNYSSKPKNKKAKPEKERERVREKEKKKHKPAENHLSAKPENGELKPQPLKGRSRRVELRCRRVTGRCLRGLWCFWRVSADSPSVCVERPRR